MSRAIMLAGFTQIDNQSERNTTMKMTVYTDAQIQRHAHLSLWGTVVWIVGLTKVFMMMAGL